jgi:hypothetical protein
VEARDRPLRSEGAAVAPHRTTTETTTSFTADFDFSDELAVKQPWERDRLDCLPSV